MVDPHSVFGPKALSIATPDAKRVRTRLADSENTEHVNRVRAFLRVRKNPRVLAK